MGLLDVASGKSIWRGLDYYERKKVICFEKKSDSIYKGKVSGSDGQVYDVEIDKAHPKKSKCTCPFAEGRQVVCKHMIAHFFTAEPNIAEEFIREVEEYEAEEELREQQRYEELRSYVYSLSKEELRERYLNVLLQEMWDEEWDEEW